MNGDFLHVPPLPVVVIQCIVVNATIVPHSHRIPRPGVAAREFGAGGVLPKVFEEWQGFFFCHAGEVRREPTIDV